MTITEIVTNIDRRLSEVRAELTHLQAARTALVNGERPVTAPQRRTPAPQRRASAPKPDPAPAPPRKAKRTRAKTSYQVVPVGKLTALLSGSEGMRTRGLAQATNGDPAQILSLLKEQETAGQVRRSGTRASTRWHLITDEERIAARAAELAARSKTKRARKS